MFDVPGSHVKQTWNITFMCYVIYELSSGAGVITANKSAEQLTTVKVTPLDIYKDTWRLLAVLTETTTGILTEP